MARSKRIALALFIGIPAVCCIGGIGYVQYQINSVGDGLEAELARTRSLGMPVMPADLTRSTPDAENAAPDYLKAIAMAANGTGNTALDKIGQANSARAKESDKNEAAAAFAEVQGILKLVESATDKPHSDFRKDWSRGYDVLFPEYAELKKFAHLLGYKARQQSKAGDWQGALTTIKRMQRLSLHAGEEAILIAGLVQIACESITHRTFRDVISDHRKNRAFLTTAGTIASQFGPLPEFKKMLKGELVGTRSAIYQVKNFTGFSGGGDTDTDALGKILGSSRSLRVAFDRKYVESFNNLIEAMPKDPEDWETAAKVSIKHQEAVDSDGSVLNILNRILFPVFEQAALAIGRDQAQRKLTLATIELFERRLATGAFPTKLPDKPVFIDPFTKKPFGYKPGGKGFLIYSFENDKVDNGGSSKSTNDQRDLPVDMR